MNLIVTKRFPSFIGAILCVILILSPHFLTIRQQALDRINLVYTPNHLNGHTVRFDDWVKLAPTFQLAKEHQVTGKFVSAEHDDRIYPNTLQEISVAFLYMPVASLFGVDSPYYFLALLVLASYILLYLIAQNLTQSTAFGIGMSLVVIFGYDTIMWKLVPLWDLPGIHNALELEIASAQYEYNSFFRVHTLGGSYFILLAFLAFAYFYANQTDQGSKVPRWAPLLVVALLALQFYTYLFYSLIAAATWVVLTVHRLFQDILSDRRPCLNFIAIGTAALLLAAPSLFDTYKLVFSSSSEGWLSRIGNTHVEHRYFEHNATIIVSGLICFFSPLNRTVKLMVAAIILITLLMENLGMITGFNIQPGHTYLRGSAPILLLVTSCALYNIYFFLLSPKLSYLRATPGILSLILAGYFCTMVFRFNEQFAKNTASFQGIHHDEKTLIRWFQDHPGNTVATLTPETAIPLAIQAPVNLYLYFSGFQYSTTSNKQIEDRLALTLSLFDTTQQDVSDYFSAGIGNSFESRYHYYYWQRRFWDDMQQLTPTALNIFEESRRLRQNPTSLCPKPFNYLLVDSSRLKQRSLGQPVNKAINLVRVLGSIEIWELTLKCEPN
jgi:hypothetical protein